MSAANDFLSPRRCFVTPILELDEAAVLLSAATDALLLGNHDLGRDLIGQADMPIIHTYASRIMGKVDTDVHRYRLVEGLSTLRQKVAQRMPAASLEAEIYERDGYRCRFCGCRVIVKAARAVMDRLLPGAIRWGAANGDRHAAFFALTATIDHLVPHARGGDNSPGNLLTTCQPCNFGKGDWLVDEIGLFDPSSRPPVVDAWDGLARIAAIRLDVARRPCVESLSSVFADNGSPVRGRRMGQQARYLPKEEWFAEFDRIQPGLSSRLLRFIDGYKDLQVSWALRDYLHVRIRRGDEFLYILGIERSGDIEIPWSIGEHKVRFRTFTEILSAGIPEAISYETPKTWRVKKAGRRLNVLELLDASSSVRTALEELRMQLDC
jgi:DNA-directed RNA polymerase subunit RPC12/RpoP